MKIRTQLFLILSFVALLAIANMANWVSSNLKPRYREAVEDSLVDLSVVFATFLEQADSPAEAAEKIMQRVKTTGVDAQVYSLSKKNVDIRLYVTDGDGKLIYSSYRANEVGQDYSNWRDVHLTLQGAYGARTTRDNKEDPASTVLYVAAPIWHGDKIAGVATIGKPTTQINSYAALARIQIAWRLLITGALVLLIGGLVSWGLTRSILLLTRYARDVRDGKSAQLPRMSNDEVGELATAFEQMRIALEGKKYIEHYTQNLTHELKSPLAGIQGAVELLREDPPEDIRDRFLANIESDLERMKGIVERLLDLSSIESKDVLAEVQKINLKALIAEVLDSFSSLAMGRKVELTFSSSKELQITGDLFLVRQAISNILDNGISFARSKVEIELTETDHSVEILIKDNGDGVPEYAQNRVFERFYSLPRPDSQRKSSGLGLCFVKEVMRLHCGSISISSAQSGGTVAKLEFPKPGFVDRPLI